MANRRLHLSLLATALVAAPLCAADGLKSIAPAALAQINSQESMRASQALARLMGLRGQFGMDADGAFSQVRVLTDHFGETHARFNQTYRGLKVWGGEVITHTDAEGQALAPTTALMGQIFLNTAPSLSQEEALATATRDLAPKGAFSTNPTIELVVYPVQSEVARLNLRDIRNGGDGQEDRQVLRFALAYHVHAELENGAEETSHTDYMIDAHTGAILKKWNTLHTTAATGTGNSQYSGTVSIQTNSVGSSYELRDMTRGAGGTFGNNVVTNLNHATSGNGTVYTDADNTWGDGTQYASGGSTTSANGQTAAVDAAFGIEKTWDLFKTVLGRNGIDGTGKASYLRVHYSSSYDNAFWSDACFCMTFGDGSSFTTLTSIDVAGHEMAHGVCATSANLTYSGESGGLNESDSDIFGTMVEFYSRGGSGTTIGNTGGNFTIGEQLAASPLRYMYKPSLDGSSPDAWSSSIGSLDVHYSSGPNNRMFYFLSQGATTSGNTSTTYLPNGMTGIGNDKAARIWYRALTVYMTSSTDYAGARAACISAAKDLYGAGGAEEQAVWNAYHGINVGAAWSGTTPPPPSGSTFVETEPNDSIATANGVAHTFTAIQGNLTVATDKDFFALQLNPGETLAIAMTGPTGPDWDLKLLNSAGTQLAISQGNTTTENLSYTNTASTAVTVYPNVYVYSGTSATPYNLALTYSGGTTPPPADTQAPTVSASESGTSGTITLSATASDNVGVTKVEFYVDGALKGSDTTSPYSMTLNSTTLSNGSHSLVAKAYDAAGNVGTSTTVSFTVSNTGGTSSELILNGGFESGATSWTQTSGVIGANGPSQPAHAGTYDAWLDGYGSSHTDYVYQQVAIPSTATSATLTFYLHIDTAETTTSTAYDKLTVLVQNTSGTTLATLGTFSNLNAASGYTLRTFDLSAYKGQTIRLMFNGVEDTSAQTSFVLDDVSVKVQ